MCGRFTLTASGEELALQFEVPEPFEMSPRFNIAPTQDVASIVAGGDGRRQLTSHRWGLIPFWAKDASIGSRMINARAETVAEKPAFRDALLSRRCVIPADGFYEWAKGGASHGPHWIHRSDRALMGFAGLYDRWKTPEGEVLESCTVITTEANDTLRPLHDRMPVLLASDSIDHWLDPEIREADPLMPLLKPCPDEWIDRRPVGPFVNDVRCDDVRCLEAPAQASLF